MKRVRITIELDEHFIRLLNAQIRIGGYGNCNENYRQHTPAMALAVAALYEARGGYPEQVHAQIPHEWRPHLEVIHDERKVFEAEEKAAA